MLKLSRRLEMRKEIRERSRRKHPREFGDVKIVVFKDKERKTGITHKMIKASCGADLAVHHTKDHQWTITHIRSGRSVLRDLETRDMANRAYALLLNVVDWTRIDYKCHPSWLVRYARATKKYVKSKRLSDSELLCLSMGKHNDSKEWEGREIEI